AQEDHRPQDRTDQIPRRMTRLASHFYAMVDPAGGHDPVTLAETLLDAGAHGVHLGQTDLPLEAARRVAGPGMMIGISTHNVEQARAAEIGGADYIGFGPMYPGGLKNIVAGVGLDKLRAIRAAVKIPIVAIGGITEAHVAE